MLVLNPIAAGTGLNITGANHVIHYNLEWNPALEDQSSARAYRRGQEKTVFIYRLYYKGTVEEVVNERIDFVKNAITYDEQPTLFSVSLTQRLRWSKGHLQAFIETGPGLFVNIFFGKMFRKNKQNVKKNFFLMYFFFFFSRSQILFLNLNHFQILLLGFLF